MFGHIHGSVSAAVFFASSPSRRSRSPFLSERPCWAPVPKASGSLIVGMVLAWRGGSDHGIV
eukprot:1150764-Alexandrium_andersonii.AAC.1